VNLLHITPYAAPAFAFGGVARAVDGLTRALARAGHAVTVLTTDAGTPARRLDVPLDALRDDVRIVRVRNLSVWARGRLNLSTPPALVQRLRALLPGVDAVHVHEWRTVENLLALPIIARAGVPIVLSPHGTLTPDTGRPALKAAWDAICSPWLADRVSAAVGLTTHEADEIRAAWARWGGAAPHVVVIPNGVDAEPFAHLPTPAAFRTRWAIGNAPVCLFLGRLHPRKGVLALARGFLDHAPHDARLVIAGGDEGVLDGLRALLNEHDPAQRVIITGYLEGVDRLAALAAADVFALPAVGEGLSMAALEALACGIPLVLSPGCHLPEAEAAGAALIVSPEAEAVGRAVAALLADPARRAVMGAAGRALAAARFTWDGVAAAYAEVYARGK
jgi:glycosyltransferase involved in cell wall biosynthesis